MTPDWDRTCFITKNSETERLVSVPPFSGFDILETLLTMTG